MDSSVDAWNKPLFGHPFIQLESQRQQIMAKQQCDDLVVCERTRRIVELVGAELALHVFMNNITISSSNVSVYSLE
jgi:hypothetical protein